MKYQTIHIEYGRKGDLWVSRVLQKAVVEVNEEGTEAAAATLMDLTLEDTAASQKPVVFKANRPFIFFIQKKETGSIVFLGRTTNPKKHAPF